MKVISMNESLKKMSEGCNCFLKGMASTLDIGATIPLDISSLYTSPEEADREALASDWGTVGNDLRIAMESYVE